jgi:putative radical SAM enzyme (TIGR03279 family)
MGKCDAVRGGMVESVKEGSIGEEAGIENGDRLISVNGSKITDILDYIYLTNDEYLLVEIEKPSGELWEIEIEKEYDENLGLVFVSPTIDNILRCHNKCLFCFVDQMPSGMRSSLYVKDDDYRLSALHGNFATFTNLGKKDLERIIRLHISPINVSVHATDPETRIRMMGNKHAGEIMKQIKVLADHHIPINGQIVLCPGLNDGKVLENTLNDLETFFPDLQSLAIVPVGITKFREGLYELEKVDKIKAREVISIVEKKRKEFKKLYGKAYVHLSDEFYIVAEMDFPTYDEYDGFLQIEDGVGMVRKFERQIHDALEKIESVSMEGFKIAMITGELSYVFIRRIADILEEKMGGLSIEVAKVENDYFGKSITVSGLVSGMDLTKKLTEIKEEIVLIPGVMIKEGTKLTVDDMDIDEIGKRLMKEIIPVDVDGFMLVDKIVKLKNRS